MSDNTASRERAEKWVTWYLNDERNVEEPDEQLVLAYLAGAREETEIKDKEIERLKCEHAGTKVLARDLESACKTGMLRIREQDAEIAALREAVRLAYITRGHKEDGTRTLIFRADAGVDWHFDLSADSVNAVFRALEGKP